MSYQQLINFYKENKFICYNVSENKMPLLPSSTSWSKITYDESIEVLQLKNENIGFRTGKQGNDKYIIGLDFDMWYKINGEYTESENTQKLFNQFIKLNSSMDGVYISSTDRNRGCLVDITKCKTLIKMIENDGRRKLQKKDYHLEVLVNFNMVLPPTATKCKITGLNTRSREFMGENKILVIESKSDIEDFILNYIGDCVKKSTIPKTSIRTKEAKHALLDYEDKEDDNEVYINNVELMKPFIDNLDIERTKNYDNWFKIGMAILNTYGKDGYKLFTRFSKKDRETYNDEVCDKCYNKTWLNYQNNYTGLNSNYIINCVKNDDPEKFIQLLLKYQIEKEKFEFDEKKNKLELDVRKVLQPAVWIMKNRKSKKWDYCDTSDIIHCYSELKGYGRDFINEYINKCNEKNYYDFIDFIPDVDFKEEDKEGYKTFNMFNGFKIKNQQIQNDNINVSKKDKVQKLFTEHLNILVNNDTNAFKMVQQWICHLLFNTTKRPGISIILKGAEGTGKTTLYNIIENLIGADYCYSTARPEKTIFSTFNDVLQEKILININEPDFNSFKNGIEEFKSLITDKEFSIESKNKPKINLSNYMWFLITTNNDRLFTLSNTDRRFYFVETSNEKIGNTEYFKDIYNMIEDDESMYYIYKYCLDVFDKEYNFTYHQKNSKTSFHQILVNTSKNPFYDFLQDMVENTDSFFNIHYNNNNKYIIQPKDFNTNYSKYCRDNDLSNLENGKTIKMKLQKIKSNVHTKFNNKSSYIFSKNEILQYLKDNKYYTDY